MDTRRTRFSHRTAARRGSSSIQRGSGPSGSLDLSAEQTMGADRPRLVAAGLDPEPASEVPPDVLRLVALPHDRRALLLHVNDLFVDLDRVSARSSWSFTRGTSRRSRRRRRSGSRRRTAARADLQDVTRSVVHTRPSSPGILRSSLRVSCPPASAKGAHARRATGRPCASHHDRLAFVEHVLALVGRDPRLDRVRPPPCPRTFARSCRTCDTTRRGTRPRRPTVPTAPGTRRPTSGATGVV